MFEVREKPNLVERALLVGVYFEKSSRDEAASLLDELAELVETLGIPIIDRQLVRALKMNAKFLMGSGKAAEIIAGARDLGCDCIIFDNDLTPAQQRAWEKEADICVIDRQEVILDIFAMRARTKEARLQVELARMEYSLPRLARMWAHLDRQRGAAGGGRGGGGAARGEGEKQIEVDRRIARQRIDRAKRELDDIRRQRGTRRKERERLPVPHAAIVGYTNAGKSSLLNRLTNAGVLVEDKLFATLDTTTRRVELPDGQILLLTDTVGFVRRLPHRLVESFKATLEESVLSDFLIHVLDAGSPDIFEHHRTTMDVLAELGADTKRIVTVLNKSDLLDDDPARRHALATHFDRAVFVSALSGDGFDGLYHAMNDMLRDRVVRLSLLVPHVRADLAALAHREGKVLSEEYGGEGIALEIVIPAPFEAPFRPFMRKETPDPQQAAAPEETEANAANAAAPAPGAGESA